MTYTPKRFKEKVDMHLITNFVPFEGCPLIMAIIGNPGMGKTYQLREYLRELGINVISINAADLENEKAGEPAKALRSKYVAAARYIDQDEPTVLLIDDIDTTLGEWENHTGTVNHQSILAFLMHIADNPCYIEGVGAVKRVPVFFTGNYFDRLYEPLVRDGRVTRFDWEPTLEEKIAILMNSYSLNDYAMVKAFVEMYPNEKVSFYTSLLRLERLDIMKNNKKISISRILKEESYKQELQDDYNKISYEQVLKNHMDNNEVTVNSSNMIEEIPVSESSEEYSESNDSEAC